MSVQLKYSFKKELAQFTRTFKLLGMILAIFGFAIANPMMYKMTAVLLDQMDQIDLPTQFGTAAIQTDAPDDTLAGDTLGGAGLGEMAAMYNNASVVFSMSLVSFATYSLLIIMLVMMKPAGGEQKKRAMIVPLCSGLQYKNYLLPKFVIYPLAVFALTFLGGLVSGGLCNSLFEIDRVDADLMAFGSLLMGVYLAFIVSVYLSLGLCTSRPGLMVGAVFLGQLFVQTLLESLKLSDYQPFSLVTVVGEMYTSPDYDLSAKYPSIFTAMAISVAMCVLMYFLAYGVLNVKKVDNQEEIKPAF